MHKNIVVDWGTHFNKLSNNNLSHKSWVIPVLKHLYTLSKVLYTINSHEHKLIGHKGFLTKEKGVTVYDYSTIEAFKTALELLDPKETLLVVGNRREDTKDMIDSFGFEVIELQTIIKHLDEK